MIQYNYNSFLTGTMSQKTSSSIFNSPTVALTPVVITVSPVNGAIDQAVSTTIVFTADKPIVLNNGDALTDTNVDALITLKETDAAGADIAFDATVTIADQQITVTPTTNLTNGINVYCKLDGVKAQDGASANVPLETTFTVVSSGISGLVAKWQFEDDLLDSSGNGYNLTTLNGGTPVYSTDVATGGLTKSFDWVNFLAGSAGDSLRSSAPLSNEMTIVFRFKNTGSSSGANRFTGSSLGNIQLRQRGFQNILDVLYNDGTSTQTLNTSTITFSSGNWGSFAVTVNQATGDILCYFDGVLSDTFSGLTITDLSSDIFFLGETSTNIPGGVMKTFMDDVRIYNSILTAQNLLDIHNGNA